MRYRKKFQTSNREMYKLENYKGKNPMSRSQWRRHQRLKKAQREYKPREIGESSSNQIPMHGARTSKPPVERKLFDSENEKEEEKMHFSPWKEDNRMANDFDSDGV